VQKIRLGVFVPVTLPTGGDAVNLVGCQYAATFWFAIKELNEELSAKNITVLGTVRDGVGMSKNTFTNGVKWATDYAQTAYNSTGVHGVVGGLLNYPTLALGYVLKEANIAQIAYGADAPDLSHNDVFPDFLRTYPSASYQGYAIADIVANYFHWERVVVAYSTDIYGTDALAEFTAGANEFGIYIVYSIAITPGQDAEDYDAAIDAAMKYAPRIFVLLTSSAPLAAS
jgi:ABC-type branched-subunit amino acid transport system substrate-binding protein